MPQVMQRQLQKQMPILAQHLQRQRLRQRRRLLIQTIYRQKFWRYLVN
jgi:hypothetical protein